MTNREEEIQKVKNVMTLLLLIGKDEWSTDQRVQWGRLGQKLLLYSLNFDDEILRLCDEKDFYKPDMIMYNDNGILPILRIEIETLTFDLEPNYEQSSFGLRCYLKRHKQLSDCSQNTILISQCKNSKTHYVAQAIDVLSCKPCIDENKAEFYDLEPIRHKITFFSNNDHSGIKEFLLKEREKRLLK